MAERLGLIEMRMDMIFWGRDTTSHIYILVYLNFIEYIMKYVCSVDCEIFDKRYGR
jgi:hypothetical protein